MQGFSYMNMLHNCFCSYLSLQVVYLNLLSRDRKKQHQGRVKGKNTVQTWRSREQQAAWEDTDNTTISQTDSKVLCYSCTVRAEGELQSVKSKFAPLHYMKHTRVWFIYANIYGNYKSKHSAFILSNLYVIINHISVQQTGQLGWKTCPHTHTYLMCALPRSLLLLLGSKFCSFFCNFSYCNSMKVNNSWRKI